MTWYLFPHIHLSLSMYYLNKNILLLLLFCVCASWVNSKWNVFRRTAIKNLSATTTKTTSTTITATTMGRRMRESNEEREKKHTAFAFENVYTRQASCASYVCFMSMPIFHKSLQFTLRSLSFSLNVENCAQHSTPLHSTRLHSMPFNHLHTHSFDLPVNI